MRISASDTTEDPNRLVDGSGLTVIDGITVHDYQATTMWKSSTASTPRTLTFDFENPLMVHDMTIWNHNSSSENVLGYGAKDITIETSMDGTHWDFFGDRVLEQAPGQPDYAANNTIAMSDTTTQYIKLTLKTNHSDLGLQTIGLSEVQFTAIPTAAREYTPAEGDRVSPRGMTASWRAGRYAASHEILLGTDPNVLDVVMTIDYTVPRPEANLSEFLVMATQYYWQVNEVNGVNVWEGPVQSFVTDSHMILDDMESYPTKEGLQIWQAWTDGYDNSNQDNGAIVGDTDGLPEKGIVFEGKQSLPLEYGVNNQSDSFITHRFDLPQDWSQHGIQKLTLYFYGVATNEIGLLYALVNDTRYNYSGNNQADLQAEQWLPFTIDLSSPMDVKKLTIGIQGGKGMLYIDDVQLTP